MKRYFFLPVILLSCLVSFGGVIPRAQSGNVYLLSIGFSYKGKLATLQNVQYYNQCTTCVTDATGISSYFDSLSNRKQAGGKLTSYVYTNDIILDTLYNVFNRIQQQIKPNDIFIFYYASIAWGLQKDENGNTEGFYVVNSNVANGKSNENYVFTLKQLKTLTDRIVAKRQLIIFDTGSGEVIQPDYFRNFFSSNVSEAYFSKNNRIVMCPENYSGESFDKKSGKLKGDMFKVISNLPDSFNILRIFDTTGTNSYKSFMYHLYQNQVGLMGHITILKETSYLKMLAAIQTSPEENGKRGFTIKTKPPAIDSNLVNRKKKALIIATSNYQAPIWATLKNPVNDASDAAAVFRSLGYEVKTVFNLPKDSILNSLSAFTEAEVQNPYDQYVVYFAGHGYYDARQKAGYIVCADSKNLKDVDKPTMSELSTYIDYTVLFRNLDQLNKVILITDVCFGGTSVNSLLQTNREADPKGERNKMLNPFKKVLASGIKEVDDFVRLHNGTVSRNSPFAAALINILQKSGSLSFEELYAKLKNGYNLDPTPVESSFGTEKIPNAFTF